MSEFKHLVCNMRIITHTDLARVLKVNSLMFVKVFEISDARCCTLGEAILLTETTGSLVAENKLPAAEAGETPEEILFCSRRKLSISRWQHLQCLHARDYHGHVHTPICMESHLLTQLWPCCVKRKVTSLLQTVWFPPTIDLWAWCIHTREGKEMNREAGQLGVELMDPHSK